MKKRKAEPKRRSARITEVRVERVASLRPYETIRIQATAQVNKESPDKVTADLTRWVDNQIYYYKNGDGL